MEFTDQAERRTLPVLWDNRELWVGFGGAVLLYILLSVLGAVLVEVLGWKNSPKIALLLPWIQLGMALPPLLIMARYGNPVRLLGLNRFQWSMLAETGAALLLGFATTIIWGLLLLAVTGERAQEPLLPEFGEGVAALISLMLVGGILAPLTEEILFRGFLFAGLTRVTGPIQAALISGALFGAIHLQPLAFPALFGLGVLLALLYYRTGSLWMPILMHLFINMVGILAQYVAAQQGVL